MREAKRIDEILERIGKVWKKYPYLRLGQIIGNLNVYVNTLYSYRSERQTTTSMPSKNLYYIEDEELAKMIEENAV